jgi:glutamate decarboxylase
LHELRSSLLCVYVFTSDLAPFVISSRQTMSSRETISMDLLDRLITDIFSVTENTMNSDEIDLKVWQPFQEKTNAEATHGNLGAKPHETHKHKRHMSKGVHRTVC